MDAIIDQRIVARLIATTLIASVSASMTFVALNEQPPNDVSLPWVQLVAIDFATLAYGRAGSSSGVTDGAAIIVAFTVAVPPSSVDSRGAYDIYTACSRVRQAIGHVTIVESDHTVQLFGTTITQDRASEGLPRMATASVIVTGSAWRTGGGDTLET